MVEHSAVNAEVGGSIPPVYLNGKVIHFDVLPIGSNPNRRQGNTFRSYFTGGNSTAIKSNRLYICLVTPVDCKILSISLKVID